MKEILHFTARNKKGENQISFNMWVNYAGFFGTFYLIHKEKWLFI